jgi:hypothetical protein
MDTNKIMLIFGLLLLLFFVMHNVRGGSSSTPTTTTTTTVFYRRPVTPVAGPNPRYNSYKAQYYN